MTIKYKTLSEQLYADSDYLTKLANKPKMREYCQEIINTTIDINRAAFKLAHPEEKTGYWIEKWDSDHLVILAYECSKCRMMMNVNTSHFCPNCGAKMEVKE